jgi:hypothetical protein
MDVMRRVASLVCIRCQAAYAVRAAANGCQACASEAPSNLRVAYQSKGVAGSFDAVVRSLREHCGFDPADPALPGH